MRKGSPTRGLALGAGLLAATLAAPANAGTVYVPLAGEWTVGNTVYSSRIWMTNPGTGAGKYENKFIANDADGTKVANRKAGGSGNVAPQGLNLLTPLATEGALGMLEVSSAEVLNLSAQVTSPAGNLVGMDLPIVSSSNAIEPDTAVDLLGLVRNPEFLSGLVLVNVDQTPATCSVRGWRANGKPIGPAVEVKPKALSHLFFADALGALSVEEISGARLNVTCNRAYYAFAVIFEPAAGDAYLVEPSGSTASSFSPPGEGGPSGCPPTAAACFQQKGTFFTTTAQEQHRYYRWAPDDRQFSRIEATFKFRLNKWDKNSNGIYTLLYLSRNSKWYGHSYALAVLRQRGRVMVEITADLPIGHSQSRVTNAQVQPGRTYDVKYVYDAANRFYAMTMKDVSSGQTIVNWNERLDTGIRQIDLQKFLGIQLSDPYVSGTDHVPLWGTWSDLVVAGFN